MSNVSQTRAAGLTAEGTYTPDSLIAGDLPIRTRKLSLASGQNVVRGAVLGLLTAAGTAVGAASTPAPAAATISAIVVAAGAAVGVHRFECVIGGAGTASKWNHYGPGGEFIGTATGNTEYTGGGLTLTITDSGTDPVAGEAFIATVTAATTAGTVKLSLLAATDGSQVPKFIAAEDVDATGGAADIVVYTSGDFNESRLTFGTGHTAEKTREALRDVGIILTKPVSA